MARGRRNDRTGPRMPPAADSSGDSSAPGDTGRPAVDATGVPSSYVTVEYQEIAQTGMPTGAPAMSDGAGEPADSARDQVMNQLEDSAAPAPEPVAPAEPARYAAPEPARRGGFVPGLIGGLLGGAAMVLGGGWYSMGHGPIKAGLERLDATATTAGEAQAGVKALDAELGQVGAGVKALDAKLGQVGTGLGALTADLGALKSTLEGAQASLGKLTDRVGAEEAATGELKTNVEQASNSFRAASQEVIGRLEAVNAKLVEVEQAQPADVVDKKTVGDIAAKQASVDAATQSVAAALARLEQLVTQSLQAGNQQAEALRTVVDATQSRLNEINAQQRDLLALKEQVARQDEADQRQLAALAETGKEVTGVRTDLEHRLTEVAGRLTALNAETGKPFQPDMAIVKELEQGDTVIGGVVAKLEPLAATGVPTYATLAKQLGDIEQSLSPAATAPPADDWLTRTRDNLEGLVNLHDAGSEAVPGQNAVVGATQALLQQDLPGAVAALQPLARQGNGAAQSWVTSAQQRLDAIAAIDALREQVKTILAQQG
jgi:predicted  nucleic acid-binding Zn-ribbon protein